MRHPNGEAFPIVDPFPASGNSLGPNRTIESVPYYYFDATTHAHREMPWYVEDLDTGERIGFVAPATRPTDDALIMWIAVLAPGNLTATAQMDGIALGWSAGQAPTGGGFIIERRESLTSGGQFTAWHELQRVSDSQTAWLDTQLAPGEYAIYRVRAYFGSGANERHSAPSNRARAARWVKKLDGQWGSPGGDDGTGGGPVGDPPGGGSGSGGSGGSSSGGDGGCSIPGDADGDGDPDNDKDGVIDTEERYLNDPLRSDDIPVKFHGVVDLGKYLVAPENPPFDVGTALPHYGAGVPLITIDDSGSRVAWAGIEDTGTLDPAGEHIYQIRCIIWQDGQITSDKSSLLTEIGTEIPPGGGPARNYIRRYVLDPVGISQERVVGNATLSELWEDPVSNSYHSSLEGQGGTFDYPLSGGGSPASFASVGRGYWFNENLQLSRGNHLLMIRRWKTNVGGYEEYHQEAKINGQILFTDGTFQSLSSAAISDGGYAIVQVSVAGGGSPPYYLCSPDGTKVAVPPPIHERMWVSGVNDQKWIVGNQDHYEDGANGGPQVHVGYENPALNFTDAATGKLRKGRGSLGLIWNPQVGLETFHDKLPDKFKKQVRSAIPAMITNVDPTTGKPRIIFYAEDYEGGTGEWKNRLMILRWKANGDPVVDRIMLPAASVDTTTHVVEEKTLWLATTNTAQDIVGLVEGKPAIA